MVESLANTAEDLLIDSFQFKIPPGASYVTERRSISYFTAGSNIYQSGSGTKIIRINITGDGWLDPGSIRLHFTLVNNDTGAGKFLRPLGGPWRFFRRVRCLIGGSIVTIVITMMQKALVIVGIHLITIILIQQLHYRVFLLMPFHIHLMQ